MFDVDSGQLTDVATDRRLMGATRVNVTRVGGELVLVPDESTGAGGGGGDVLATTSGPRSPLRRIGSSDPALRPSGTPGRIWLSSVTDYNPATGRPETKLTQVDLTGQVHQRVTFDNTFGAEPFGRAFLRLAQGDRDVELVTAAGRRLRVYAGMTFAYGDADHALLRQQGCTSKCRLVLLEAASPGPGHTLRLPEFGRAIGNDLVVAPSGERIVVGVPAGPAEGPPAAVHLVRVSDGTAHAVNAWSYVFYGLRPTFTDDGRWMLFIDADGSHVDVCDLVTGRPYRAPGSIRGLTQLVALP